MKTRASTSCEGGPSSPTVAYTVREERPEALHGQALMGAELLTHERQKPEVVGVLVCAPELSEFGFLRGLGPWREVGRIRVEGKAALIPRWMSPGVVEPPLAPGPHVFHSTR